MKSDDFEGWLGNWLKRPAGAVIVKAQSNDQELICEAVRRKKVETKIIGNAENQIMIDETRGLIDKAGRSAWRGQQIFVIRSADRLSLPAAQSILKLIEEMPIDVWILLLTQWPGRLLPTIRSRCEQIYLSPSVQAKPSQSRLAGSLVSRYVKQAKLEPADLDEIERVLNEKMRTGQATAATRIGLQRLRDYYLMERSGGNVKLAKDLLLIAVSEVAKN